MFLVEIIRGQETGDRAVAKALDYVRQIRKTPIVVNDARFFYANRCIIPYINEGIRMVAEGVSPLSIMRRVCWASQWGRYNWLMKHPLIWAQKSPARPRRRWAMPIRRRCG